MDNFPKGSCSTMCPAEEMEMREKERLLHRLEMISGSEWTKIPKADPNKTVKCFSRSAADTKMDVPHRLRPFHVLKKTVHYLLSLSLTNRDVSSLSCYNFVSDRFRSVRQDTTIQALAPYETIQLLEPMVVFYTLYIYKFGEMSRDDFDPFLNKKHLLNCLKQILVCIDTVDQSQELNLCALSENERSTYVVIFDCDRVLMEALYILINLGDNHPLQRYLKLPRKYKTKSASLAYKIATEFTRGNFVRACRIAQQLRPIELCAFSQHLPQMQCLALEVFSHAYNSKQITFPCEVLTKCAMFNTSEETRSVCTHYGLKCENGQIHFSKLDFRKDAKLPQPKTLEFLNQRIRNLEIRYEEMEIKL